MLPTLTLAATRVLVFRVATVMAIGGAGMAMVPQKQEPAPAPAPSPIDGQQQKKHKGLFKQIFGIFLPPDQRIENWSGRGGGCCGHAVCAMMLHECGQHKMAVWWQANHNSPSTISNMVNELNQRGYSASSVDSTYEVERYIKDGKPVGYRCWVGGWHARMVVFLDGNTAKYIDPNYPQKVVTVERREWERSFNRAHDGFVIHQESKRIKRLREEYGRQKKESKNG